MIPIKIQIGEKAYQTNMKSSWNELTFDELNHVISLLQSPKPHFLAADEHIGLLKLNLFVALTNSAKFPIHSIFSEWEAVRDSQDEDGRLQFLTELQAVLNESLSFLFTTIRRFQKDIEVIAPDLTRCPMPKLAIPTNRGVKNLIAPSVGKNSKSENLIGSDIFANMTIYELGMSFSLYEKWVDDNEDATLNELLAVIFREKKPATKENMSKNYGGDVRLPLRNYEATISRRKDLIARNVPRHIKNVLVFWFGCCRHHFAAAYPSVFSGGDGEANQYGYASIILELSRSTHSSKNEISDQNAHGTMIELMYENDRAKAMMPTE